MSQQAPNILLDEESPRPVDIVREILRGTGTLSRLMEIYYLVQEPSLLDIMCRSACERTGRICLGNGLDPLYVDTAVRR